MTLTLARPGVRHTHASRNTLLAERPAFAWAIIVHFGALAVSSWPVCLITLTLVAAAAVGPSRSAGTLLTPTPALVAFTMASVGMLVAAMFAFNDNPLTGRGIVLLLQFASLPMIALLFWATPHGFRTIDTIWWGCVAGVTGAAATAIVKVALLGHPRADGWGVNAIAFGNVALILGAVAAVLAPLTAIAPDDLRRARHLGMWAAWCGVTTSILSGSRGGWLILPFLAAAALLLDRERSRRRSLSSITQWAGASLAVSYLAIPMLGRRLVAADHEIEAYFSGARTGSSIGARFEAWRSSWNAFLEQPISGIGWGNLPQYFDHDVAQGLHNERIATFDHAHNQILGALASSGIIGAVATLTLVAVPAWCFARRLRSTDWVQRRVAIAGLVVVAGYAVAGLTEAMLEHLMPTAAYALLVAALCSQLTALPAHAGNERIDPNAIANRVVVGAGRGHIDRVLVGGDRHRPSIAEFGAVNMASAEPVPVATLRRERSVRADELQAKANDAVVAGARLGFHVS